MRVLIMIDMQKGAALSRYHGRYLNRWWWQRMTQVQANVMRLSGRVDKILSVTDRRFRISSHFDLFDGVKGLAARSTRVWKGQDSGANEVLPHISLDDELIVSGMNTDACVIRTVRALRKLGFTRITVAGDACWTAYAARDTRPHHQALSRMRKIADVQVATTAHLCAA